MSVLSRERKTVKITKIKLKSEPFSKKSPSAFGVKRTDMIEASGDFLVANRKLTVLICTEARIARRKIVNRPRGQDVRHVRFHENEAGD